MLKESQLIKTEMDLKGHSTQIPLFKDKETETKRNDGISSTLRLHYHNKEAFNFGSNSKSG